MSRSAQPPPARTCPPTRSADRGCRTRPAGRRRRRRSPRRWSRRRRTPRGVRQAAAPRRSAAPNSTPRRHVGCGAAPPRSASRRRADGTDRPAGRRSPKRATPAAGPPPVRWPTAGHQADGRSPRPRRRCSRPGRSRRWPPAPGHQQFHRRIRRGAARGSRRPEAGQVAGCWPAPLRPDPKAPGLWPTLGPADTARGSPTPGRRRRRSDARSCRPPTGRQHRPASRRPVRWRRSRIRCRLAVRGSWQSRRPSAESTACAMVASSVTGASSTSQTPSAQRSTQGRPASTASLVFPAPPGPTIVVSRPSSISAAMRASSARGRRSWTPR